MFLTPADVINSSLRLCGVIGKSETPSNDEMMDALQALNLMLEQWSARRLIVRATIPVFFPLVPGKASYTIGPAGDIVISKPFDVVSGYTRDSNNIDMNLSVISYFEYDAIGDKAVVMARPIFVCYYPGAAQQSVGTGLVTFYPMPDSTQQYTAALQLQVALTDFVSLTDAVTFEPMYGEAMKYGLAARMWREYHNAKTEIPSDILGLAASSMSVIEKINHVLPTASIEVPPQKTVYNIYSDSYR